MVFVGIWPARKAYLKCGLVSGLQASSQLTLLGMAAMALNAFSSCLSVFLLVCKFLVGAFKRLVPEGERSTFIYSFAAD
jgi:hypothetical protein